MILPKIRYMIKRQYIPYRSPHECVPNEKAIRQDNPVNMLDKLSVRDVVIGKDMDGHGGKGSHITNRQSQQVPSGRGSLKISRSGIQRVIVFDIPTSPMASPRRYHVIEDL